MANKRGMAGWMQWTIYLGIAALSGLLWLPLGQHVNREFFSGDPFTNSALWAWLSLFGFLTALTYRLFSGSREGKEPAAWCLALLVPSIAVFACVATMIVERAGNLGGPDFILILIVGNLIAYVSLGWLIIPLAIPYVMLIGWLHRETIRFAVEASRRSVRHLAWGFACLVLVGASEAPRMRGYAIRSAFEQATTHLGVSLPEGTELVTNWHQDGPEGNRGIWFRLNAPPRWPLVPGQRPLTNPDDREMIRYRASEVGIPTDTSMTFAQGKWQRDGRTVQVTRIQTKDGDYLEFIPW